MELFEAMMGRRSVRKLDSAPLEPGDLDRILDAGRHAPSWANSQCQEIIAVTDRELLGQLAESLSSTNPAREAVRNAPCVLVACGRKGRSGFKKGEQTTTLGDWLMFDLALFMQNVTLAAHALGYGTVHVGLFDHRGVAGLLEIPDDVQVVEILPIGRPIGDAPKAPRRREPGEFVHAERYGKSQRG